MRAADEPPVCHTLIDRGSRFAQSEHRQRASAGSGQKRDLALPLVPAALAFDEDGDGSSGHAAKRTVRHACPQQAALRDTV